MLIKQRFPNFVEVGGEIPIHKIKTLEDFHALDFVQHWMERSYFKEFQYSENGYDSEYLMALTTDGKWWVIAVVREGSLADIGLEQWVSPCS